MQDDKFKSLAKIEDPLGAILAGGSEETFKFLLGLFPPVKGMADIAYFGPKEELKRRRVEEAVTELQEDVKRLGRNPFADLTAQKSSDPQRYESICAALEQIYDRISEERDINKRKLLIQHLKKAVLGIQTIEINIIQEFTEILTQLNIRDIEVFKLVMSKVNQTDAQKKTVVASSSNIPGISQNQVLISIFKLYNLGLIDFATQGRGPGFGVSGALSEGLARYNGYGINFYEYLTKQL